MLKPLVIQGLVIIIYLGKIIKRLGEQNKVQTITHEIPNIHPIFDDFDRMYNQLSVKEEQKSLFVNQYDPIFKDLYDTFVKFGHVGNIHYNPKEYPKIKTRKKSHNIIICFSGGKDSIAVAKYYKELNYNIYLYHMKHINQSLADEHIYAKEIADYLGVPIFIDSIKLSGHHDYVEHPMKNMIIVNGAIQYGLRNNIGVNIATGNYTTSSLRDDNFEFCGGDDIEMWWLYEDIIRRVLPNFEVNIPLKSLDDTLEMVCGEKELLDMSVSCLCRHSMRDYWHDWVFTKYGINIPKHRCGRCYKCCLEYIYMADKDLQEYNEDYYKYCFLNLRKNFQREDDKKYTNKMVWEHYFSHDIEESKYFKDKVVKNYHLKEREHKNV